MFKDEVYTLCGGSTKLLDSVVLEFKAESYVDLSMDDRKRFINMLKRRKSISRRKDLVQATAPLESHTGSFVEPDDYAAEKGVTSIER